MSTVPRLDGKYYLFPLHQEIATRPMDPEVFKFIAQAVISLCGALLAAILAAHIAMKKFRKEKWWQRKSEIYSELINELHELKYPKERFF